MNPTRSASATWPVDADPSPLRHDLPHLVLLFLLLSTLYWWSAPPSVVLEDDGLFLLSAAFLGIEHPPGFPLYVLLAKLATLVPAGTVAWRVHALSGLFAALACVMLWLILRRLLPGRLPAWLGALGLGLSTGFWSQALIADVYSLNAFLYLWLLLLALDQFGSALHGRSGHPGRLYGMAFLGGLALSNHWPLLLLSAPALLLLVLAVWRDLLRRLLGLLAMVLLGLTPYLWMVWRSQQAPEISFLGPVAFVDLLGYVSREVYAGVDDSLTSGWLDRVSYLGLVGKLAAVQLTPVGLLLALYGLWVQWWRLPRAVAVALTLAFVGPTLLLVALLGFDWQELQRQAFRVYPLLAWAVLAAWAAVGLADIGARVAPRFAPYLTFGIVFAVLTLTLGAGLAENARGSDRFAQRYAEAVLEAMPPGALLLTHADVDTGAIGYLNRVEGVRPDVLVLNDHGVVLEPRLFHPLSTLPEEQEAILEDRAARHDRPVLTTVNRGDGEVGWLVHRALSNLSRGFEQDCLGGGRDGDARARRCYRLSPSERRFLELLLDMETPAEPWTRLQRVGFVRDFVRWATSAQIDGAWPDDPWLANALKRSLVLPVARLDRAGMLAASGVSHFETEADFLLEVLRRQSLPTLDKREQAWLWLLVARRAGARSDPALMEEALKRSVAAWPHPDNRAYAVLAQVKERKEAVRTGRWPGAGSGDQ